MGSNAMLSRATSVAAVVSSGQARVSTTRHVQFRVAAPETPSCPSDDGFFVHLDQNYAVVNKPTNVRLESLAHEPDTPSIEAMVRARLPDLGKFGLVHQLDIGTSGVLVVGRGKYPCRVAGALFERRLTRKAYLAVVHGDVGFATKRLPPYVERRGAPETFLDASYQAALSRCLSALGTDASAVRECFTVSAPIMDQALDHRVFVAADGKPAQSHAFVLRRGVCHGRNSTEMLLMPVTGRRHQLRAHMQLINHPIGMATWCLR